jgi:hypothetical protein
MNKYFARLDQNNIVIEVIVANSKKWCLDNLGGNWVSAGDNELKASIGYIYNEKEKNFTNPNEKLEEDKT